MLIYQQLIDFIYSIGALSALTPSSNRQFDQVVFVVCVEDLYQQQVEVKRLYSHPGETAEQGVMHERCDEHTHPVWFDCGAHLSEQEGCVEQKQSPTQGYMNGDGVVPSVAFEQEKNDTRTKGHMSKLYT